MKASLLIHIAAALALLNACRKGPEDPLFSLETRKARICTPWVLTDVKKNEVVTSRNNSFVNTTIVNTLFRNDSLRLITIYQGDTAVSRKGYYYDCQFFKDNSYVSNLTIRSKSEDTIFLGTDPVTNSEYKYLAEYDTIINAGVYGSWDFGADSGHRKKQLVIIKSHKVSQTISCSLTYTSLNGGPEMDSIVKSYHSETNSGIPSIMQYEISALFNDRLVLSRVMDSSYTKWAGETFPNAFRVTGNERIEFKKR